jgi:hypothetical protein
MSVKQIVTPIKYSDKQKYVIKRDAIHKYLFRKRSAMKIEWDASNKKRTGEKAHFTPKKKGIKHNPSLSTSIFGRTNLQLKTDIIGITKSQEIKIT